MIPVCIPYKPSMWGEELKYALRSWDRYFNEDFTICVIGGERPEWLNPEYFVYMEDDPTKHKEANLGRILNYCVETYSEFVWSNDDIFLIGDTCFPFIKRPLFHQMDVGLLGKTPQQRNMSDRLSSAYQYYRKTGKINGLEGIKNVLWQILLAGTVDRLKEFRYTAYNGETHTPYYYESEKLLRLSRLFDIFETGLHLARTAYINVFVKNREDLFMMNGEKAGYYGHGKIMESEDPDKIKYLNFNDAGLTKTLKDAIQDTFTEPSRFEVIV